MTTFIEGKAVHLRDVNGFPAIIPASQIHRLAHRANQHDLGRVSFGYRWFDQDTLNGARDLLDSAERCTFSDYWTECDQYATRDADGAYMTDLRDRPVCDQHAPHDDKDD